MLKTGTNSVVLFYLHYILISSGLSSVTILLGVFLKEYSDASQGEIGMVLMTFPFVQLFIRPYFGYQADRHQAHRGFLIGSIAVITITFGSVTAIPFFPAFYKNHARLSWWIMAVNSVIGAASIGLVWSIGDALAVNAVTKANANFSRMRLSGTISWGVYGYIIGRINDVSFLPKYTPSFLILLASFLVEILLMAVWNEEAFKMGNYDEPQRLQEAELDLRHGISNSSSLAGSLRLNKRAKLAFRDLMSREELLTEKLNELSKQSCQVVENKLDRKSLLKAIDLSTSMVLSKASSTSQTTDGGRSTTLESTSLDDNAEVRTQNLQAILLKMILKTDGRLIKYLILYTAIGFVISPINFLFMSYEDACKRQGGYNFSNLAGLIVMSQAGMETITFFLLPYTKQFVSSSSIMISVMLILTTRSLYYAFYFYTSGASLYWAVIAEWGCGSTYAMYTALMADLSLMFANQSGQFIGILREMGVISDPKLVGREKSRAEEARIRVALRATMQAIFGGAYDGLGTGLGSLASGLIYDLYGYIWLWKIFALLDMITLFALLSVELSISRYSDRRYPSSKEQLKAVESH